MPAIIFDLFGTLLKPGSDVRAHEELSKHLAEIHTEIFTWEEHYRLYRKIIQETPPGSRYPSGDAVWEALMKLAQIKGFTPKLTKEETLKLHVEYHVRYSEPYPEAEEVLRKAKGVLGKVGLVSDSDAGLPQAILKATGIIHFFDAIVVSGEEGTRKPDPELFLKAAEILKTPPEECIVIGDSWRDVIGAINAGMTPILLQNKEGVDSHKLEGIRYYTANTLEEGVEKALYITTRSYFHP